MMQELYWRPKNMKHPFRRSIRIQFILKLLQDPEFESSLGLNLKKLKLQSIILSNYPIHSLTELKLLKESWLLSFSVFNLLSFDPLINQPLFKIKEYFGNGVGLYFTLIEHFVEFYTPIVIIGVVFQIVILSYQNYNFPVNPFYAYFICVWFTLILALWNRKEKLTCLYWGILEQKKLPDENTVRPEFIGVSQVSVIDGMETIGYSSNFFRDLRFAISMAVWFFVVAFGILSVIGMYILRYELSIHSVSPYEQYIISIINGIWIIVYNHFIFLVSVAITNFENHRVNLKYDRSLLGKA